MHLTQALTQAVNTKIPATPLRRAIGRILLISLLGVTTLLFVRAREKTAREAAYRESFIGLRDIKDARNFGRVIVDSQGLIKDWNRGMTVQFGGTKQEMLGKTLDSLVPMSAPPAEAELARFLFRRAVNPMLGSANLDLVNRNGELAYYRVRFVDPDDSQYRELTFVEMDRMVYVTPDKVRAMELR